MGIHRKQVRETQSSSYEMKLEFIIQYVPVGQGLEVALSIRPTQMDCSKLRTGMASVLEIILFH
jgi:hypothetical protein